MKEGWEKAFLGRPPQGMAYGLQLCSLSPAFAVLHICYDVVMSEIPVSSGQESSLATLSLPQIQPRNTCSSGHGGQPRPRQLELATFTVTSS